MEKVLSCGFVIMERETGKVLCCHPTGKKFTRGFWDIPKGHLENYETPLQCAKRELYEETGITDLPGKIYDLGMFPYTDYKDLHVFCTKVDKIDVKSLDCNTYFDSFGKKLKEVNGYELVDDVTYFYRKLRPIVLKALEVLKNE